MSAQQEQANELLKNFGRRPRVRACYPCAKRKIRCHGGEPCSTCAKRGHPEICFYTGEQTRRTRAAQKAIARASISDSEMSTQLGIGIGNVQVSGPSQHDGGPQSLQVSHSNGGSPVNIQQRHDGNRSTGSASSAQSRHHTVMGSLSAASFVRNSLGPPNEHLSHDIRLGLGLQNILPSGLAKLSTSQSIPASSELLEISPNRREVLRFLQPLRTYVLPFYPLVSDEDDFELSLYSFLEDVEGQMASKAGDDKVLLTQGRSAEAGLFLALLAVGIQFADLPNDEREDKAYNLIERSVACLRLSDFLLKPGVEIVQTLVVLGTYLQNAGQSDGAWSLLGLTHRLARSLGLHSPNSGDEHFLW
ncbi:hypothetical protein LTR09_012689 [Extremus antarcticus]|uniref:Zn(2)-C6 fungal-type domain-containing protein n=1 Tax=Extremus antarcticus TaxID=702011 RepID=A0AAJ0D9M1_9PEZI|nr:hypothetical protein LTR09_012689 [Extremus antarcticus]